MQTNIFQAHPQFGQLSNKDNYKTSFNNAKDRGRKLSEKKLWQSKPTEHSAMPGKEEIEDNIPSGFSTQSNVDSFESKQDKEPVNPYLGQDYVTELNKFFMMKKR